MTAQGLTIARDRACQSGSTLLRMLRLQQVAGAQRGALPCTRLPRTSAPNPWQAPRS
jgi:hypothetical protein